MLWAYSAVILIQLLQNMATVGLLTTQSLLSRKSVHGLLSVLAPHAFPRHNAVVLIVRVRVDVPLPQLLLQSDQAVQRDITQSRLLY